MRTTIDLPVQLRQKLIAEAAARNLKGFSTLIADALEQYFSKEAGERSKVISELRGCISFDEYEEEMKRIEEGRKNWRT